jgi:glycosyltransferase involved in cell wall biosynthesis
MTPASSGKLGRMPSPTGPHRLSIVIPAKDEEPSVGVLVAALRRQNPHAEIIVVDDGSRDATAEVARAAGANVVRHPVSRGNGAAIKAGARAATGDVLAFMDADGQHDPEDLPRLLQRLDEGYDMAVGARTSRMHAGLGRLFANGAYNALATWITGVTISDLTSGFRVARAEPFRQFLALLPNGFSYPTTITMAFLRAGYNVIFDPINVRRRGEGRRSHIRLWRDGARFFVIIFRVGTLYSPLKLFAPISATFFALGLAYYGYTLLTTGRFTNLGALLFSTSVIVFLIGLISEQITTLQYLASGRRPQD